MTIVFYRLYGDVNFSRGFSAVQVIGDMEDEVMHFQVVLEVLRDGFVAYGSTEDVATDSPCAVAVARMVHRRI